MSSLSLSLSSPSPSPSYIVIYISPLKFVVCTSQFVVMFIGGDFSGKSKRSCNAYLSQSTRGLRSLLTEHVSCTTHYICILTHSSICFIHILLKNCFIVFVVWCLGFRKIVDKKNVPVGNT